MAYAMTKQGSLDNCITYEFICDTITDMNAIENKYRTIGSVAIVLQGESDGLEVYITGSDKQWTSLANVTGSNVTSSGLNIHICSQDEVNSGLPSVEDPSETTIYLVAASEESNNLYEEYIYVNEGWEKFGGATINLSGYYQKPTNGIPAADLASGVIPDTSVFAPKASPVFTRSISLGRTGTTGTNSIAVGSQVTASGSYSQALGSWSSASALYTHAEGNNTTASSEGAHAEGYNTTASGQYSHVDGYYTTASGPYSHASGYYTESPGIATNVCGYYNVIDTRWPAWQKNHSYSQGEKVKYSNAGYICAIAHTSANSFNSSKWTKYFGDTDHIFIVGNGTASNARSNAFAVKWDGSVEEGKNTSATGDQSHAEGFGTTASNMAAHAEGISTTASGPFSHAEGNNTTASGQSAHAEGYGTTASGQSAHTEGNGTTAAGMTAHAEGYASGTFTLNGTTYTPGAYSMSDHIEGYMCATISGLQPGNHAEGFQSVAAGNVSHAEGQGTLASGNYSHSSGIYTIASGYCSQAGGNNTRANGAFEIAYGKFNVADRWPEWETEHSYSVGDKVYRSQNNTGYICTADHTSTDTFDSTKWDASYYTSDNVFIIGNGTADDARSNAYTLDWNGTGHYKGDIYVGCNNDSTGGSKVATETFVTTRVPVAPVSDGTYILQCSVNSGTPTYSWVSLSSLSGVTF